MYIFWSCHLSAGKLFFKGCSKFLWSCIYCVLCLSLTISNSLPLCACVINHFTSCEPLIGNKEFVFYIPDKLKIFEKILEQQLSDFFEYIFNPYLCAFRRGHGCQTTLLRLLEDWRNALDKNQYVATVLMDLSKAFDCLPHDILLDKLSAYGMSTDSVSLLESYLSNRKQQIKINSILSSWADIQKDVP